MDQPGYCSDFCDGEAFKRNPLFSLHKDALQIMFYYDDLEICNPLGSKKSIHKLGICTIIYACTVLCSNTSLPQINTSLILRAWKEIEAQACIRTYKVHVQKNCCALFTT